MVNINYFRNPGEITELGNLMFWHKRAVRDGNAEYINTYEKRALTLLADQGVDVKKKDIINQYRTELLTLKSRPETQILERKLNFIYFLAYRKGRFGLAINMGLAKHHLAEHMKLTA